MYTVMCTREKRTISNKMEEVNERDILTFTPKFRYVLLAKVVSATTITAVRFNRRNACRSCVNIFFAASQTQKQRFYYFSTFFFLSFFNFSLRSFRSRVCSVRYILSLDDILQRSERLSECLFASFEIINRRRSFNYVYLYVRDHVLRKFTLTVPKCCGHSVEKVFRELRVALLSIRTEQRRDNDVSARLLQYFVDRFAKNPRKSN